MPDECAERMKIRRLPDAASRAIERAGQPAPNFARRTASAFSGDPYGGGPRLRWRQKGRALAQGSGAFKLI
jgi:hypothetical protein